MNVQTKIAIERSYEIRLCSESGVHLIFMTAKLNDDEAAEHARNLLERHPSYAHAEVWQGMKMIRGV